jgi:hypothetical protein
MAEESDHELALIKRRERNAMRKQTWRARIKLASKELGVKGCTRCGRFRKDSSACPCSRTTSRMACWIRGELHEPYVSAQSNVGTRSSSTSCLPSVDSNTISRPPSPSISVQSTSSGSTLIDSIYPEYNQYVDIAPKDGTGTNLPQLIMFKSDSDPDCELEQCFGVYDDNSSTNVHIRFGMNDLDNNDGEFKDDFSYLDEY